MKKTEATLGDFSSGALFGSLIGTVFIDMLTMTPTLWDRWGFHWDIPLWATIRFLVVGAYIIWVDYFRSKEKLALTNCLFILLCAESLICANGRVCRDVFYDFKPLLAISLLSMLILFPVTLVVGLPMFALRRKIGFLPTLLSSLLVGALTGALSATLLFGGMRKDVYLTCMFAVGGAITALACFIYVMCPSNALSAMRLSRPQRSKSSASALDVV